MRKQVLARNGKLYYLDHPKPIISPYVMMPDQIRTHQHLSAEARQTSFGSMIEMALETAVRV